jgi:Fur family ferric uptake transcriptional regulator
MEELVSKAGRKLRAKEYKLTPQREEILRVLYQHRDKHLSAEDIHFLVKQRTPDVGLATVYRTLELLLDCDLVHRIDFGDGRQRYEVVTGPDAGHHHHHLICTRCGRILEVEEDLLEALEQRVALAYGFQVTNHQLKMFGTCRECRE